MKPSTISWFKERGHVLPRELEADFQRADKIIDGFIEKKAVSKALFVKMWGLITKRARHVKCNGVLESDLLMYDCLEQSVTKRRQLAPGVQYNVYVRTAAVALFKFQMWLSSQNQDAYLLLLQNTKLWPHQYLNYTLEVTTLIISILSIKSDGGFVRFSADTELAKDLHFKNSIEGKDIEIPFMGMEVCIPGISDSHKINVFVISDSSTERIHFTAIPEKKAWPCKFILEKNNITIDQQLDAIDKETSSVEEYGLPSVARLFRPVVNLICYINNRDDDIIRSNEKQIQRLEQREAKTVDGSRKRKKASSALDRALQDTIYIVGKKYAQEVSGTTGATRKKRVPHIVRGFYRMQRFGPARRLVKRIWVKPHVRCLVQGAFYPEPKKYKVLN